MTQTFLALAPIRICDLGGWTDTWFAKQGAILNIAVKPFAQCLVQVSEAVDGEEKFFISVDDYGERYRLDVRDIKFGHHPLLDACVKSLEIPSGLDVEVSLHSAVPGGSSTGTSAAITVALLAALDCLSRDRLRMWPRELAAKAHEVETVLLKQQSGIQDQICSAFGGVSYIEMDEYPHSKVTPVPVPEGTLTELDRRLSLIFLGKPHYSTSVHETVIRGLVEGSTASLLDPLRREAKVGRDALIAGDLQAFGASMIRNTEAQGNLNAALVNETACRIFDIARRHGALGWKVNGAGGDGGSVTLLSDGNESEKKEMLEEIAALGGGIREIGIRLSRQGVRIIQG